MIIHSFPNVSFRRNKKTPAENQQGFYSVLNKLLLFTLARHDTDRSPF